MNNSNSNGPQSTNHNVANNIEKALILVEAICTHSEGFMTKPYLCPGKKWTIGYGTTEYPNGETVGQFDPECSEVQAREWLKWTLEHRYLHALLQLSPNLKKYPYRLAAILDFTYNLGRNAYAKSTLRQRVREENWEEVKIELRRWIYAGGEVMPGLISRREEECDLIDADK